MPTASDAAPRPPAPPDLAASTQEWTGHLLEAQAPACQVLGSWLYARLLSAAAADLRRGGPTWEVLRPHATRDNDSALALRFMAAVHRLVLVGRAPRLARFYPSVGGEASGDAWPAFVTTLEEHADGLRRLVGLPCQTNEVNRCAALLPGFLAVARDTGLPLRVLELGASGGLNLRWDHYHYAAQQDGREWGPPSRVELGGRWDVPHHLLDTSVAVVERLGCDPDPVDPLSEEGGLRLSSSVWADQPLRFRRLRAALQVAAEVPVAVAPARAGDWLPPRLAEPAVGLATVVYQSVVMQYLPPAERREVVDAVAAAGARASARAPLFWLRMEPEDPLRAMRVRLTAWPHGRQRLLATAGAHGDPVRWRDT